MLTRELSEDEFQETFISPMKDITKSADEIVDLWAYAAPVIEEAFPDASDWDWFVKHIYESAGAEYQHLLVPVPLDNTYFVVVVDVPSRTIVGHHQLGLGAKYGLRD